MRRACTLLLLLTALLVACGKYGPPRRVRPEPTAPAAAAAEPAPVVAPAELEAESAPAEPTDAQEENQ
jgi:hypothetical protein